jgi:hypothetical protein
MLDAGMINMSDVRIDGGAGMDTVSFNAGTFGDAGVLASILTKIEFIDFSQAGADANMSFTAAHIQAITGGIGNTLTIDADGGDSILTSGADVVNNGGGSYTYYADSDHTGTGTVLANLMIQ